ncbi:DUF1835 domain-containing protein [Fictibacillus sp. KU28468]|uniref:DUF1835 domain-containing protein n=1 Tax=Fictibacillus sp. KU28468 TaxID=2991053 RepID=UPI00223D017E|nr:DUF1835 domain-containing protein [Fictibacillus sp. KU28468]UZJ78410.1 DUF1835 domain-containing protein [Fictibacillus sp. KU28468]
MKVHIVNGDITGNKLQDLDGEVIVWREMYDLGPAAADMDRKRIKSRAEFFEKKMGIPSEIFLKNCTLQENRLRALPKDAEITLWLEHDRYDQTMLLYLLKSLGSHEFNNLNMVTADSYPGIEPFFGLGQLSELQLIGLLEHRISIRREQIMEGAAGWNAYASPNPRDLEEWLKCAECSLPFVKRALWHHLEYYPSVKNGLNQVEELAFQYLYDGITSFHELFQKVSAKRTDDGLSDFHFSALLDQLQKGPVPLLKMTEGSLPHYNTEPEDAAIELTYEGIEVLMEREDRFDYTSADWWLGGVYNHRGKWRWNGEKLIDMEERQG